MSGQQYDVRKLRGDPQSAKALRYSTTRLLKWRIRAASEIARVGASVESSSTERCLPGTSMRILPAQYLPNIAVVAEIMILVRCADIELSSIVLLLMK